MAHSFGTIFEFGSFARPTSMFSSLDSAFAACVCSSAYGSSRMHGTKTLIKGPTFSGSWAANINARAAPAWTSRFARPKISVIVSVVDVSDARSALHRCDLSCPAIFDSNPGHISINAIALLMSNLAPLPSRGMPCNDASPSLRHDSNAVTSSRIRFR